MSEESTAGADTSASATRDRAEGLITGAVVILIGMTCLMMSRSIEITQGGQTGVGPKFWPSILTWALILGGALICIQGLRGKLKTSQDPRMSREGFIPMLGTLVLLGVNLFLWPRAGFLPTTFVILLVLPILYGGRRPLRILLFAVLVTALLYGLFDLLLKVPL